MVIKWLLHVSIGMLHISSSAPSIYLMIDVFCDRMNIAFSLSMFSGLQCLCWRIQSIKSIKPNLPFSHIVRIDVVIWNLGGWYNHNVAILRHYFDHVHRRTNTISFVWYFRMITKIATNFTKITIEVALVVISLKRICCTQMCPTILFKMKMLIYVNASD